MPIGPIVTEAVIKSKNAFLWIHADIKNVVVFEQQNTFL